MHYYALLNINIMTLGRNAYLYLVLLERSCSCVYYIDTKRTPVKKCPYFVFSVCVWLCGCVCSYKVADVGARHVNVCEPGRHL